MRNKAACTSSARSTAAPRPGVSESTAQTVDHTYWYRLSRGRASRIVISGLSSRCFLRFHAICHVYRCCVTPVLPEPMRYVAASAAARKPGVPSSTGTLRGPLSSNAMVESG
ncbi:Uncharacterised protein [Mycobacteroides abscessus subsp. abscessus]|nr:Uncharacterised protein [Mycobacteroides abscessus subsp. abscessus]